MTAQPFTLWFELLYNRLPCEIQDQLLSTVWAAVVLKVYVLSLHYYFILFASLNIEETNSNTETHLGPRGLRRTAGLDSDQATVAPLSILISVINSILDILMSWIAFKCWSVIISLHGHVDTHYTHTKWLPAEMLWSSTSLVNAFLWSWKPPAGAPGA